MFESIGVDANAAGAVCIPAGDVYGAASVTGAEAQRVHSAVISKWCVVEWLNCGRCALVGRLREGGWQEHNLHKVACELGKGQLVWSGLRVEIH